MSLFVLHVQIIQYNDARTQKLYKVMKTMHLFTLDLVVVNTHTCLFASLSLLLVITICFLLQGYSVSIGYAFYLNNFSPNISTVQIILPNFVLK